MSTPFAEAERIKTLYGTLVSAQSDELEVISYPVTGEEESFLIVFAAIGITQREAAFFLSEFERTGKR